MKLDRAYSLLEIKGVDEDSRIITGIATTPTADRVGDVVDSMGASFKLPIPFLWQHDSHSPLGHVTAAKVTKAGIEITAQIAKGVSARIDEAWALIKAGLVQGLSIGFKGLDRENIPGSFGVLHKKWLWLELSAVTIPANGEATIQTVKSIDTELLAASGNGTGDTPPGDSGKHKPVKLRPKEGNTMKTNAEQITALEATRAAKAARMEEIMQKSMDAGQTTDAAEKEEFDTLQAEVEQIEGDLKRFKVLEKIQITKAKPVEAARDGVVAHEVRGGHEPIMVRQPTVSPGIRMARVMRCMGLAFKEISKGNLVSPIQVAENLYKHDPIIANVLKANVGAGSTASGNWADGLVGAETSVFADFVEYLRPMTILGKFGTGGIPSLRTVPFRVALVGQTGGGQGYWVGEGKAKPLTNFDFSRTTLEPLKVANICVLTDELIRDSSPSAETIIRDSLVNALRERLDRDFIDPDKAASAGVSPASVLNGVAGLASSGTDADSIRADLRTLFGAFIAANNAPTTGVWIMSARTALALSLMMNPLGQTEFPGITMNGGTFAGLPVITSEYVTFNTSGDFVALINASDIYIADEGGFNVDMSREASLEMSDAPAHNSTTPTAAQLVSMFQTNSVAFRAERAISWKRRRNEGVAWLSGVHWGETTT